MKLSRDLSLFSVTMIGVGAMIGAGIFVLTGIAAGVAGPAIMLAFLLNGIVALFTASAYAELGGSIPEAGGGYLWVKQTLPQPSGFLSGWMSWMAHSVACSLYAVGFGAYFLEVLIQFKIPLFLPPEIQRRVFAVAAVSIFSYINYRGAKEAGTAGSIVTVLKIFVLLLFVVLGSRIILWQEPIRFEHFSPFFAKGFLGILTAMGLTYIAFEGYEIIAQSGEEIKDPEKNIPKATFYSLLIVVPIYILVAFVALGVVNPGSMSAWNFLAEKKEIAVVEAARDIGTWGSIALLIGGLLSTLSALNATIYSSSRVSFALGRDYNLPAVFSRVNKRFRTPEGSIIVSSVLIVIMLLLLPIEDIASGADIMFLFLFIFVNIALIHIRSKTPKRLKGYRSPLFPLFPVMGILTQIILVLVMFSYSPKSFFITVLWIGTGLSIYFGYSRFKEKEKVGPQILLEEKELAHKEFKLVVGLEEEREIMPLMNLAIPIAKEKDGEIYVTHVISLPPQTPLDTGKEFMQGIKGLLETADKIGEQNRIPVSVNVRVSHKIHQGLLDSVVESKGNLLLLGTGEVKPRGKIIGRVLDPVLQEVPCHIGIMKTTEASTFKKVLVPTAGGPNARLAFEFASWIVKQNKGQLTLLYIIPDETKREIGKFQLNETKKGVVFESKWVEDKIVVGKNIAKIIVGEGKEHDMIIMGASKQGLWRRIRFGSIPERIVRSSPVPVLIVRKYEGIILSWLRRFIAG